MAEEQVFRWVLIIGLMAVLPVGMYHRIKAHAQGDKIDRRGEGWFILLTLRPIGMAGMVGLLCYVINPAWMAWSSMPLPTAARWIGVGLGVCGGLLFIVTLRTLGNNLTDTVVIREKHTLVTTGPYRFVRHPFYVACALAIVANTLVSANWFMGATGIAVLVLLGLRTPIEERNLRARFGEAYKEYASRTGRFIPRL